MDTVTQSVDVDVDLDAAYERWADFEALPRFMEGVDAVQRLPDGRLHWTVRVGPVVHEYDAVITKNVPREVIAWETTDGPMHSGRVTFRRLDVDATEVTLEMTVDPDGFVETLVDRAGLLDARVAGDLMRFKAAVEGGNVETGSDADSAGWQTVSMGEATPVGPIVTDPAADASAPAAQQFGGSSRYGSDRLSFFAQGGDDNE